VQKVNLLFFRFAGVLSFNSASLQKMTIFRPEKILFKMHRLLYIFCFFKLEIGSFQVKIQSERGKMLAIPVFKASLNGLNDPFSRNKNFKNIILPDNFSTELQWG